MYTEFVTHIPNKNCDMCLMPFSKDPGPREHLNYCSYCFKNGELTYTGSDLHEFQQLCYDRMRKAGMGKLKAKFFSWAIRFAPHWKKGGIENAPVNYH